MAGPFHNVWLVYILLRPVGEQPVCVRYVDHDIVRPVHDEHRSGNLRYPANVGEQVTGSEQASRRAEAVVVGDDPDPRQHW
eukprot:CAMPEP_0198209692 /NCGR_PEP_ID=MMETSP1445-20131203/17670_1 /TAXON_ID=36898 /ORGANISM="Pyramimonas sp., Strain CCMP2087" /LENGTH=80 /DNA_ID=CAMNT_0043883545 /DNA_START=157 /DNA_END=396 /DNA_ORIENTATION=-